MILEVFIDFFFVKITVGWSKYICNLIIVVGFNFGANMVILIYFRYIPIYHRYISDILPIFPIYFRYFTDISDISPIFYRYFRYISDILKQKISHARVCSTYRNFAEISVRYRYIGEISPIFLDFSRFFL